MSLHIVGNNLVHRYQTYYENSVSNGVLMYLDKLRK